MLHPPLLAVIALCRVTAQVEYTGDGTPTPREEEFRWLLNRGRFDSAAENTARGTSYADIPRSGPPLAPNASLARASVRHAEDMARASVFQHATLTSSSYYDARTQPGPPHRMTAEGYGPATAPNAAYYSENISVGTTTTLAAYLAWWNSTSGHRTGMYGTAPGTGTSNRREIGYGYFYYTGNAYMHHHVLNLNSTGDQNFFTGTIFRDTNGDKLYTQGEGVAGVRVDLRINGVLHSFCDVSAAAGNFAVPISTIPPGTRVNVYLRNQNAAAVTLHIPISHATLNPLTLTPNQQAGWGNFIQSDLTGTAAINVGFRNLTLGVVEPLILPQVTIVKSGNTVTLSWPSQAGYTYRPQWSGNMETWTNTSGPLLTGTGGTLTITDSVPGVTERFYKVIVTSP